MITFTSKVLESPSLVDEVDDVVEETFPCIVEVSPLVSRSSGDSISLIGNINHSNGRSNSEVILKLRVGDVETHGQSRGIVMGPFGPDILPRFNLNRVQLWPYRNNIPENCLDVISYR